MCGVAGIFSKQGKIEFETLRKMEESMVPRGPDDGGIYTSEDKRLGLVHRRLAILDLSPLGHQPMISSDGYLVIVHNGEIYNFWELRKELENKGYRFKSQTDTEVILALYAEYGKKSFSMLRGMFAFGLWDSTRGKLYLVRDRYGIKPLYYYSDNEKLIFASTVKTIIESGLVSPVKDLKAFIGFLLFGSVPTPITTYKNILSIPAGHYLVRGINGEQRLVKYYELLDHFKNKTHMSQEGADILNKVRQLLKDSVNLHLISDAPLGVLLSGGIDSSTIAILAASLRSFPITTLSIIFDEKEYSEEQFSDLIAEKIKSNHYKIKITSKDFHQGFEDFLEAMDQPTVNGVNTFFIARAVKEVGLKTVLSGLGGDEIFCGYQSFRKAELLRKIQGIPTFFKFPLILFSLLGDRYAKLGYLKNNDILNFYLSIRGLFTPEAIAKILDINLSQVYEFLEELSARGLSEQSLTWLHPVDLLSYLEMRFYLQNQLLKDTDFMSMYHSVEVRVPFLDHKLVEYVSGLPAQIKIKGIQARGRYKPLLVNAINDLLPKEIVTRSKMGFTFPFQKWLKEGEVLSEIGEELKGIPNLYRFYRRFTSKGKIHWSRIWSLYILGKFLGK